MRYLLRTNAVRKMAVLLGDSSLPVGNASTTVHICVPHMASTSLSTDTGTLVCSHCSASPTCRQPTARASARSPSSWLVRYRSAARLATRARRRGRARASRLDSLSAHATRRHLMRVRDDVLVLGERAAERRRHLCEHVDDDLRVRLLLQRLLLRRTGGREGGARGRVLLSAVCDTCPPRAAMLTL